MDRCVNCGILLGHCNALGRRPLHDEMILSVFRRWLAPQFVCSSDCVCQACWDLAQSPHVDDQRRPLGHRKICLRCGRSLASRTRHLLHTNTTRESRIYNVIQKWIIPRTIQAASEICHTCWVAADRAGGGRTSRGRTSRPSTSSQQNQDIQPLQLGRSPSTSPNESIGSNQPEPTIVLPDYMRAIENERRCFIEGCQRTERYKVPLTTRKMLLHQYKYYIPENNRLCDQHLVIEAWDFLDSLRSNYVQSFTAEHIQDMMSLK